MKNKWKKWNFVVDDPSMGTTGVSQDTEDPAITEEYDSTIGDMAKVSLQAMTLEHADEMIEAYDPEMAEDYRRIVKAARKNSPNATMVMDIFTPDVLSAISGGAGFIRKAGKIGDFIKKMAKGEGKLGSIAQDAATSMAVQHGESGEISGVNTALSTGVGQAIKAVPKALFKDTEKTRAGYLGMKDRIKDFQPKAKGLETGEDVVRDTIDRLDGANFLQGGKHTFDPATLTWTPANIGSKAKGKVVPANAKELLDRSQKGKDSIFAEMETIIEKHETNQMPMFVDPEFGVESGTKGTWSRLDLEESVLMEIQESMPTMSKAEQNKIVREVNHQFSEIFGEGGGEATVRDLIRAKRALYSRTDYNKESDAMGVNLRKSMAGLLNKEINEAIPDPRFQQLNKMYGDLSEADKSLRMHKDKKFAQTEEFKAKYGALSPLYGAMSFVQDRFEDIAKPASQMSKTIQDSPVLQEVIKTPLRKAPAQLFSPDGNQGAYPSSSMISPQERLEMNMSKKLQQTKVPRNSQAIQQNPNILKYKIAQNADSIVARKMIKAGLDPESMPEVVTSEAENLYKNAEMLLTEMPDEIPAILPVWTKTMPELFEKDRYGRIDDVVPASMRQDAAKEIEKSGKYGTKKSTHEMIAELDELHSTGKYYG